MTTTNGHRAAPRRRQPKNIVVCLDGTNNRVRGTCNTNVLRLFHLLDLEDPDAQVAYYGPGVGTFAATGAWSPPAQAISRGLGLAFGAGIRPALGSAYTFVMSVYEPGDHLYVFGFSRGAYTARALCGMLEVYGVFRRGCEGIVPYAVREYTALRNVDEPGDGASENGRGRWKGIDAFGDFARRRWVPDPNRPDGRSLEYRHVPIRFVGLWDTVNAVGTRLRTIGWPWTAALPHAQTVRSAVALDEWRWRYRPVFVRRADKRHTYRSRSDIQQVWFAGVHSDVGGRYPDGARLSDIPLAWMVREAMDAGLRVRRGRLRAAIDPSATRRATGDRLISLTLAEATGDPHPNGRLWALLGVSRRRPADGALVHASVRERLADPRRGARYASLVEGCTFVDEDWRDLSWALGPSEPVPSAEPEVREPEVREPAVAEPAATVRDRPPRPS